MKIPLKIRIFALVCLLVILSVTVLFVVLRKDLADRLHDSFEARGLIIADYFARNTVEGIIIEDKYGLAETLANLFKIEDIIYAGVYDKEGTVIVSKEIVFVGEGLGMTEADRVTNHTVSQVKVGRDNEIRALDFRIAAFDEKRERIGWVRVGVNLARIDSELHKMTVRSLMVLTIFVAVALVVSFLLANNIANPINAVAAAIRAFGEGDFDRTVTTTRTDELGQLANGFNQMAGNLRARSEELQASREELVVKADALRTAHDKLEVRVQERTQELAELNTALQIEVNERKQSEEKLLRITKVVEESNDAISMADPQGNHFYQNRSFTEHFEYTVEELAAIGGAPTPPDLFVDKAIANEIRDRVVHGGAWAGEVELVSKSGTCFPYYVRSNAVKDEEGQIIGLISVHSNIQAQKQAEAEKKSLADQLHQSQKLEAIGSLAGGIAHDFNNLLTIIMGYCEVMERDIHADDPLTKSIAKIKTAGQKAVELTQQLLAYSRKQTLELRVISLSQVVAGLEGMLRRVIGEDIEFKTRFDAGLGWVMADPTQIERVTMNLVVNARDAMPMGGSLLIETANIDLDEDYARHHLDVEPGRYAMLAVSDTGCGMDEETRSKIFEPFFTTKVKGKGTGLGLSTLYGIVKQSGGHIAVKSDPGKGTTIRIYLPLTEEKPADKVDRIVNGGLHGENEHILVVEDEPDLCELIEKLLVDLNYRVTVVTNGNEALSAIEKNHLTPDLVLTDVIMPGMSGAELAQRLLKIMPDLKILYMSGYTDSVIDHHGVLEPDTPFLHKPFSGDELAEKLRKQLRGATTRSCRRT